RLVGLRGRNARDLAQSHGPNDGDRVLLCLSQLAIVDHDIEHGAGCADPNLNRVALFAGGLQVIEHNAGDGSAVLGSHAHCTTDLIIEPVAEKDVVNDRAAWSIDGQYAIEQEEERAAINNRVPAPRPAADNM